ncbi:MAG: helix-turn-helix domain-containing protein [Myxococcota bacterium]
MPAPLKVTHHLSAEDLLNRIESTEDETLKKHLQMVYMVTNGHSVSEVARQMGFARQWVARIVHRYNRGGVDALGDRRHGNTGRPSLLTNDVRGELQRLLQGPAPDGRRWTGPTLARWLEGRLGKKIHVQRVYEWAEQVGHPIGRKKHK